MQYEFFDGGRHSELMADFLNNKEVNKFCERLEYEEWKAKLFFFLEPKIAEKIIKIIEKELVSIGARINLIEKAIHAILAGEDLSKVEKIEEIELASLEVAFGLHYKTSGDLSCAFRSMIASYESDKLTYEQYKDSDNEEKQSWAEQAKMRANKTASTYNNYILENEFIWSRNVPADIKSELIYID